MFRDFSTKPAHVDDFADVADVADVDDVDDVVDVTNIANVDDVMKSKLEEAGCGHTWNLSKNLHRWIFRLKI